MFAKDLLIPISQLCKGVCSMIVHARVITKGAINKSVGQENPLKLKLIIYYDFMSM